MSEMTSEVARPERTSSLAFPAFYDERWERTVRQVSLMVGSVAVAEDIAHDALVQVYERWDRIDDPGAYLHRCASNGALRWLGHRDRRHPLPAEEALGPPAPPPAVDFVEVAELLGRLPDRQ